MYAHTHSFAQIFTLSLLRTIGSVFIWEQLENASCEPGLWQPRGQLLSVVTDMHNSPIFDMCYTGPLYYENGDEKASGVGGGVGGDSDNAFWVERVVSVSQDGVINTWKVHPQSSSGVAENVPLEHIISLNVLSSDGTYGAPRCLSFNTDCSAIIIGTTGNSIALLSGSGLTHTTDAVETAECGECNVSISVIMNGHSGKVRKVAAASHGRFFATISGDASYGPFHIIYST